MPRSAKIDWRKEGGEFSLRVPAGTAVEQTLTFPSPLEKAGGRFWMTLEPGAKARLCVERNGLQKGAAASETVFSVQIGEGASLDYFESDSAEESQTHSSTVVFELGPKARLRSVIAAVGKGACRTKVSAYLKGPAASAWLSGLSLLEGEGRAFHEAAAFHEASSCTSRQFYKNVLAGRSRSEFESLVSVSRGASKTDSDQLSKSLLLSADARAMARPWLRIDADDVSCTHGAAVGHLQGEELFYLKTRGLAEKTAKWLLVNGFAQEVLERVDDRAVRASWKEDASRRLEHMLAEG